MTEDEIMRLPIEADDSLARLRAAITHAEAERLLLVPNGKIGDLTNGLWLKALAREADRSGKQLALLTNAAPLRRAAQRLTIRTFASEEAAERADWGEAFAPPALRDDELLAERRAERIALGGSPIGSWNDRLITTGLLFAGAILLGALMLLLIPGATIALQPETQALSVALPVIVDSGSEEVNLDTETIPSDVQIAAVEGQLSGPTTGRRDIPATRATGQVLFINVTGGNVAIPSGTIVSTSAGTPVRFRTTADVTLPATVNGTATAPVEAELPGPSGNVQPFQIRIIEGSAAASARVLNEGAFEGGDVQQQNVVTQADKDLLLAQLTQQLITSGENELRRRLAEESPDVTLLPGSLTIEITAETYSHALDAATDNLTLDLRATVAGVAISATGLDSLGRAALRERVPEGYQLDTESITMTPGEAQRGGDGLLRLALRAEGEATARVLPSQVRELVLGKPLDEAYRVLEGELPLAAKPQISLSPGWWSRLPLVAIRIDVTMLNDDRPAASP